MKKLLILDMDETLLHTESFRESFKEQLSITMEIY